MKCFSAPGKALLAGGYLVLDPKYKAYVVALSTRMHSVTEGEPVAAAPNTSRIIVDSPQFLGGTWSYDFPVPFVGTLQDTSASRNPFLLSTIETILGYVEPESHATIKITIFSDPGYHSQNDAMVKESNGKRFLYHKDTISNVPKTGLGSSAGLVTVLTSGLLSYYKPELDLFSEIGLRTVHNLAQISHCAAQGKVGSGFDVAAATYGSIIYQRFDPEIINGLIKYKEEVFSSSPTEYSKKLQSVVNCKWEMIIQKCDLPPQVRILMGDVNNGSETPKLVSKVLKWRKENPEEAGNLYHDLNFYNMKLVSELLTLTQISIENPERYEADLISFVDDYSLIQLKHLIKMSGSSSNFPDSLKPLLDIIESVSSIRGGLQSLTKKTGADIEPMEQTILLDNCFALPGVLGGVVPGAGGYDAICLLCSEKAIPKILKLTAAKDAEELNHIKHELESSSIHRQQEFSNVDLDCFDPSLFKSVTWLDLHEENTGLVKEDPLHYVELLN
ncbi:phosphomevalonate kinase [Saccharomycopsis crataegensis]|uniref:Phosphomevalonate kinase n=1 Tax=Saccharomycopsis crataegensis TaxID=43959 RepID=A0AAV5QFN7_9ASCO|nr:phosphomevalonate kinase [Saccharomycopsis crataegensis]